MYIIMSDFWTRLPVVDPQACIYICGVPLKYHAIFSLRLSVTDTQNISYGDWCSDSSGKLKCLQFT